MSINRHPKQLAWMQLFQDRTGFDACIGLPELESGKIGFSEFAQANIKWYEAHSQGAITDITRNVPTFSKRSWLT